MKKKTRHFVREYRVRSVFWRNLLCTLLLVFLPVLIMVSFYSSYLRRDAEERLISARFETLSRSARVIDGVLAETENFTYMLSINHSVKMFVFLEPDQLARSVYSNMIQQSIKLYTGTFPYVESVYLYAEDSGIVIDELRGSPLDKMLDRSWLPAYEKMTGTTFRIDARLKNDYYPYYITLMYPIKNGRKKEGAVIVNVNVEKLAKLVDSGGTGQLFLFNENKLLYASDVRLLERGELPDWTEALPPSGSRTIHTEKGLMLLTFKASEQFDWTYAMLTPMEEEKRIDLSFLPIAVITLSITLIVALVLTNLTYAPVGALLKAIEEKRDSKQRVQSVPYLDTQNSGEIAYIKSVIMGERQRNRELTSELSDRMRTLNDTQLVMLQNQINPHFIYNTLDMINWSICEKLGEDSDASAMITTLAALLRVSLSRASYLVSVAEEIEHTRLYLDLMQRRFSDGRLHIAWDVDESLLTCRMPKLTLQPLIENAINHGLRPHRYHGTLRIRIASEGETLLISVEDDGVGMNEAAVDALNRTLDMETPDEDDVRPHVGLRNIHQRIRLLWASLGDVYGIRVSPQPEGFRVEMRIPRVCTDQPQEI
ncbi:MAG: histidine kinase [Clostridiales bacterium]|nr:histidine kinase [Clostridiales bacterium]